MSQSPAPRVYKPAAVRRGEIIAAAAIEFAETGLAGTRLEAIAARAEVSHPRIVQMFGSKRELFLEVVTWVFDRVSEAFVSTATAHQANSGPALVALGDAYRRLLQRDRTVALVLLHAYAAAGDPVVRDEVAARYLTLQQTITDLTGADAMGVRTFVATGLLVTVSSALALPGKRTDAQWGGWLLELVTPVVTGRH
ncbi:TetR/AcrR family transcriptional regulator [Mycolicibacterium aichiense]|uniref:TetR family transcriptional regulator n=1 Tax=Mycolicibacterium aichiense TaxID=1799 RepID=A0AAD1HQB0_9MYCO|nr:TetR/AcrR family transcriptional regulator [Mycolicibacterium aichiense]MCV7021660.1 TetR/AcrR family transcriptional regulator [Mycolicibacterium aichiense]BBX08964.1 TetR family transcriptional regulator [Mycolicibacterium aichiense]STZ82756.1 transcriptional regulator [Mycolicibacterium aichiense]